jgi:hypothetical protein
MKTTGHSATSKETQSTGRNDTKQTYLSNGQPRESENNKKYFILVWLVIENSEGIDLFKELCIEFIPDVHS